jgi:hypothetical protein
MRAADQWAQIERALPPDWSEVQLTFTPEDSMAEAATALGPLQPGRVGDTLRLHVQRADGGLERARNILRRLDGRRVWGTLELVGTIEDVVPVDRTVEQTAEQEVELTATATPLVAQWEEVLAELPPDWSDLLCELRLDSSDHLPRAALLGAPMNPSRIPDETALRFRASGKQGYGVSPQMARRCFERMDAEDIAGSLGVLQSLSEIQNAVTQGPVWRLAGRSV